VLPFEAPGSDSGAAHLGEGLAEELIARLGHIDPLHLGVIAGESARRYADTGHGLRDARSVLGADFVLESAVSREGDRLRVRATLSRVRDGVRLSSDTMDRDVREVRALEDAIAASVARALALPRIPGPRPARTVHPAAFGATLRARHFARSRTPGDLLRAAAAFREALLADSTHAPAWSGIADIYATIGRHGLLPPREVFPLARAAALRALAIDSTRAEAWSALGVVQFAFDRDTPGAEHSLRRALELNPGDVAARRAHAELLVVTGRTARGLAEIDRALATDPLSPAVHAEKGLLQFFARRYDAAALQLITTLGLDPGFRAAHEHLAWVNFMKGDHDGSLHHTLKALEVSGMTAADLQHQRERHEALGWKAWRLENARTLAGAAEPGVSAYGVALEFAAAGEAAEALAWLERAFERREADLLAIGADPRLDPLRERPDFRALVQRVGLAGS
jgi:TolB-like protein/Tfp pilus assembly protein PilF